MKSQKILTATANKLNFVSEKKLTTAQRTAQLLSFLNIDKNIFKFQSVLREADRLQKNKHLTV